MFVLRNTPIEKKLILIVITVCSIAFILSALAIGTYEVVTFRQMRVQEVSTLAEIVGLNCAAAVAVKDQHSANETLAALSDVPHVVSAVLYGSDDKEFARFMSSHAKRDLLPDTALTAGVTIKSNQLLLSRKIILHDETEGIICIQSDMGDLFLRLLRFAEIIGLIVLTLGILAFTRLQRLVIDPIIALVQTVNAISKKKDYSIRASARSGDELGVLVAGFNQMLTEIETRDTALHQAHDKQEERIVQRTRELEQEIAVRKHVEEQQQELLQKLDTANKDLNDFAYVVSHDLKAPIRAIGSLASWLASDYSDKLDDDGREKLNLLVGRTKRMHDLINGILEYSRIGRVKDQVVATNLNELVKDIVDILAPSDNIQVMVQKDLPTVRYDRTRLMQVFQNLIGNAMKYMDKPKGTIKVICADEGSYWQFTVKDNGPGIHWKYFDKIFQLFQTLAPRDESESTGVGLALVKKIVTMWGGKIWVESEVGSGSSFIFTFLKT